MESGSKPLDMAIDTREKRISGALAMMPFRAALPLADGTIGPADRMQVCNVYSGIRASLPQATLTADEDVVGIIGALFEPDSVSSDDVIFQGDWGPKSADAGDVVVEHYVGRVVESYVKYPELWPGASADRILVASVSVFHSRTTDYVVRYIREGQDTDKTFNFTGKRMGLLVHGESQIDTGFFEVIAGSIGRDLNIQIESLTVGTFRAAGMEIVYERTRF